MSTGGFMTQKIIIGQKLINLKIIYFKINFLCVLCGFCVMKKVNAKRKDAEIRRQREHR
jgi:hypothetical protein